MKKLFTVICLSILSACTHTATVGQPIDPGRVENIVVGKTTRAELESWFGPPSGLSRAADGSLVLQWTYVQSTAGKKNYIPFYPAVAGTDLQTDIQTLQVILDAQNRVTEFTSNQAKSHNPDQEPT